MEGAPRRDGWLPRAEHVWIRHHSVDQPQLPGLLLAWRRAGTEGRRARWEGWVIYVELGPPAHDAGPFVRQGWLGASGITPRA
ncbi:hypothetical protein D9V37_05980 [Nocardioides mangrovicus]|uniref:Uncharacterized protein n=1 Tax=Nocardioides mangrovicus TaxID=2478913 RepID=A0A3L8P3B8_9ACTN|nr:hypothetical protein [Nocardioides mangrovicus]RLV49487.1 hypothetical protein D9V37_05980 [Nocardioides mangrovicus]